MLHKTNKKREMIEISNIVIFVFVLSKSTLFDNIQKLVNVKRKYEVGR